MLHRGDGDGFSEEQLQMYKDCFKLMDINKVYSLEMGNNSKMNEIEFFYILQILPMQEVLLTARRNLVDIGSCLSVSA